MVDKTPVTFRRVGASDYEFNLPKAAPDAADSVIVVKTDGPVRGQAGRLIETRWGDNRLLAFDAQARGPGFTYGDGKTARFYVDGLERAGNSLVWPVRATQAAPVKVSLRYSTPDGATVPDARFVVRYGDTVLSAPIAATASPTDLRRLDLGVLPLRAGDLSDLSLSIEGGRSPVHVFDLQLAR
jgi:hypothetical protein